MQPVIFDYYLVKVGGTSNTPFVPPINAHFIHTGIKVILSSLKIKTSFPVFPEGGILHKLLSYLEFVKILNATCTQL